MTRRERVDLRSAIRKIMAEEDDFHGGMTILCLLAGLDYPVGRLLAQPMKTVTLSEITSKPNSTFRVREEFLQGSVYTGESAAAKEETA